MTEFHAHTWSHITDLPADWPDYVGKDVLNYVSTWQEEAGKLKNEAVYKKFLERLRRKWAIETGVIERLYVISEGASLTLIEKGLDAALVDRSETDLEPERVVQIIRDQHQALEALRQCITDERRLTPGYLKQLHQVITANQQFCEAKNPQGEYFQATLIRGDWKRWPNNIEFGDGTGFEFCPPEQVASEIDQLLLWHHEHFEKNVLPEVEAAWLHHRFTLTHPFMDGNGRIARCLATLVMLKYDRLPPVITRQDRTKYFECLREADRGSLIPLVSFFCDLEHRAIREALSLSSDVLIGNKKTRQIVESAVSKLNARAQMDVERRKQLLTVCDALHDFAVRHLEQVAEDFRSEVSSSDQEIIVKINSAKRSDTAATYYYGQIVACAQELRYRANLDIYQAWAVLVIEVPPRQRTEILFSFHGIGAKAVGVMGCAGMTYQKMQSWGEDGTRESKFENLVSLSDRPFEFTYRDDEKTILVNYGRWLDKCIQGGLRRWSETL